jgi:hypothetical protein
MKEEKCNVSQMYAYNIKYDDEIDEQFLSKEVCVL